MPPENPTHADPLQTVTVVGSPSVPTGLPAEPPRPAKNIPGYELIRELGRGGMGVVYEARQEGLDRIVALKMILSGEHASRDAIARFEKEAAAIAKLAHPNIVQVHAIGQFEALPYFVLEYCSGGTLKERLQPGKGSAFAVYIQRPIPAETPNTFQFSGRSAALDMLVSRSMSSSVKPDRHPGMIASSWVPG